MGVENSVRIDDGNLNYLESDGWYYGGRSTAYTHSACVGISSFES